MKTFQISCRVKITREDIDRPVIARTHKNKRINKKWQRMASYGKPFYIQRYHW